MDPSPQEVARRIPTTDTARRERVRGGPFSFLQGSDRSESRKSERLGPGFQVQQPLLSPQAAAVPRQ